jgi:hypothetical protein
MLAARSRFETMMRIAIAMPLIALLPLGGYSAEAPGVFVRVSLLSPREVEWRMHIVVHLERGKQAHRYIGKESAASADKAGWIQGQQSHWIDLASLLGKGVASVRFLFETKPAGKEKGIAARFDVATAANDAAIVRSIAEHDTGQVIALRLPADLIKDRKWLLSIREDTQRRLDEVKALKLPEGPLPRRIWCLAGFRSNGQFYTDPAIAEMDFDIIKMLGMNGFWQQNGGQPGALRKMAAAHGLDRSTVYWRSVGALPRDTKLRGAVALNWDALHRYIDRVYSDDIARTRAAHPSGMPSIIADLSDEPGGQIFDGAEYQQEFRSFLRQRGFSPGFFGKQSWEEVAAPRLSWREGPQEADRRHAREFFKIREQVVGNPRTKNEPSDICLRRLFYWSSVFWNHVTARLYALATRKVEELAPGVGTRVNFGPPWVYDYGTLPRGIDAFEFGKLRGVSLGFNEDWIGNGSPRVPMELNTLLIDWSRAAARPAEPKLGSYITRDANRTAVKLRTLACLAREARIFDFYYYGPAYTFFDHWSDNFPMVQGVGELMRDLGAVDDILADGRAPRAQAALLYSKSWPVWKEDDTEQCEQMQVYLALLHSGVPVDIVSDEEVADGRFLARGYRCLYVVNESVPAAAAEAIEQWVRSGGRLWCSGWAGMRDEYNTPTQAWDAMLGAHSRTWKPVGDLKRLGQPIRVIDYRRPIFAREMTILRPEPSTQPYQTAHGAGLVHVTPRTVGKDYMDAAREVEGKLAKAIVFPAGSQREAIAAFALQAGVQPAAHTSANQVLAWPLWTQHKGVVLLANFSGEAATKMLVRFRSPIALSKVRSLRTGELKFAKTQGEYELAMPMAEVTDVLVVE